MIEYNYNTSVFCPHGTFPDGCGACTGEYIKGLEVENKILRLCLVESMEWNWIDSDAPEPFDLDELPDINEIGRATLEVRTISKLERPD